MIREFIYRNWRDRSSVNVIPRELTPRCRRWALCKKEKKEKRKRNRKLHASRVSFGIARYTSRRFQPRELSVPRGLSIELVRDGPNGEATKIIFIPIFRSILLVRRQRSRSARESSRSRRGPRRCNPVTPGVPSPAWKSQSHDSHVGSHMTIAQVPSRE